jgi:hypothetical protein
VPITSSTEESGVIIDDVTRRVWAALREKSQPYAPFSVHTRRGGGPKCVTPKRLKPPRRRSQLCTPRQRAVVRQLEEDSVLLRGTRFFFEDDEPIDSKGDPELKKPHESKDPGFGRHRPFDKLNGMVGAELRWIDIEPINDDSGIESWDVDLPSDGESDLQFDGDDADVIGFLRTNGSICGELIAA